MAVKALSSIFQRTGLNLTEEQCYSALDDFYERFNDDVLNYHNSTIAEFLNNIRWSIYQYLEPEFQRSIEYTEEINGVKTYKFNYPADVENEFAKKCYGDLMNKIRSKASVTPFKVNRFIQSRY